MMGLPIIVMNPYLTAKLGAREKQAGGLPTGVENRKLYRSY
jgi:hypothetical protein